MAWVGTSAKTRERRWSAADVNKDGLASLVVGGGKIGPYIVADDNVEDVRSASQDLGGVNGLVNNAGIFRDGLIVRQRETGAVKTVV